MIFGKNTTEAINKLSYRIPLADDAVVITTMMEHHSNDLPWRVQLLGGDKSSMPGMVRMSFGCYNNTDDIDRMMEMLERVAANDNQGDYQLDIASGEYLPVDYEEPILDFLPLGMHSS